MRKEIILSLKSFSKYKFYFISIIILMFLSFFSVVYIYSNYESLNVEIKNYFKKNAAWDIIISGAPFEETFTYIKEDIPSNLEIPPIESASALLKAVNEFEGVKQAAPIFLGKTWLYDQQNFHPLKLMGIDFKQLNHFGADSSIRGVLLSSTLYKEQAADSEESKTFTFLKDPALFLTPRQVISGSSLNYPGRWVLTEPRLAAQLHDKTSNYQDPIKEKLKIENNEIFNAKKLKEDRDFFEVITPPADRAKESEERVPVNSIGILLEDEAGFMETKRNISLIVENKKTAAYVFSFMSLKNSVLQPEPPALIAIVVLMNLIIFLIFLRLVYLMFRNRFRHRNFNKAAPHMLVRITLFILLTGVLCILISIFLTYILPNPGLFIKDNSYSIPGEDFLFQISTKGISIAIGCMGLITMGGVLFSVYKILEAKRYD